MEIRPNTNIDSVTRVKNAPSPPSRPIHADASVSAFEGSRALEAQLSDVPEARPDRVARARHLIGDPAYPPRETIQKLAVLLAMSAKDHSAD